MENQGRRLALACPPCLVLAGKEGTVYPLIQAGPLVLKTLTMAAFGKHRGPAVPAPAIGLTLSFAKRSLTAHTTFSETDFPLFPLSRS